MELRQLRYFVTVAETRNISRAARKIFLTQPALSRQIKALESELGETLLERKANSVSLTPMGEIVFTEAVDLLARADRLVERIKETRQGTRLRIGYAPSLAAGFLSPAVENFSQAHPDARVELFDLATCELITGIKRNEIDAAITVKNDEVSQLKWTTLLRAPYRLAVRNNHPLAARKRITATDVAREPLLLLSQTMYPDYNETIVGWIEGQGLKIRVGGEFDGGDSMITAVESGLGVAMMSTRTAHLYPNRVTLKKVEGSPKPLTIGVAFRKGREEEKPLAVFVEELKRAAKSM